MSYFITCLPIRVFYKKDVLTNFTKNPKESIRDENLPSVNLQALGMQILLKKDTIVTIIL